MWYIYTLTIYEENNILKFVLLQKAFFSGTQNTNFVQTGGQNTEKNTKLSKTIQIGPQIVRPSSDI